MEKQKIYEFDPQIYPYKVWIAVGLSDDEAKEKFSVSKFDIRTRGQVDEVYEYKGAYARGAIIRYNTPSDIDFCTVAHEVAHVAIRLFKYIGSPINCDSQEPFAYLCGWVAKCMDEVKQIELSNISNK